jgi:D-alanyl-D-alanine carboxypeptidase
MRPTLSWSAAFITGQIRRALAVAAVASLAACAAESDPLGTTSNGSIRGRVADDAGASVANVTVTLTGNAQTARTTSSAADGVFTFADVPPGTYALSIAAPAGLTIDAASTPSVTVSSGAEAIASFVLNRPPDAVFAAKLRTWLETSTAADQFSGVVLVTRNGNTVFEGAYGRADRERNIPNTMNTQFRAGSTYKMLTAIAVLQLVQEGKLRLDAPFGTYLTDYPNADMSSKATIHHLLTHTGGTGDIFGPQFNANRLQLREIDDYLKLYGTRNLLFTPGTQNAYSNYGFMLLGAVVERVSGMRYDDYITARVLKPAGMTATGTAPEDSIVPNRYNGYMRQTAGGPWVSNVSTLPYRGMPAGGGYFTAEDLARLAAAVREHKLLDAAHTELLTSGKVQISATIKYAYGFMDRVLGGRRFVGHGGSAPGQSAEMVYEPNGGYVIVILSNFDPPLAGLLLNFIGMELPK